MPIPTDPLLAQQWHLNNPNPALLDLNLFGVWNPTEGPAYTGAGTRTFVIDNGFDFNHSDLVPNYNLGLDFDFENNTLTAFGGPFDSHGTAVMGIIGAAANGTGAVGIAHETDLVGYRTANLISDAWLQDVRDAIGAAGDPSRFGDVINISQGIANDALSEFGNGYNLTRFAEIRTEIGDSVELGRGGLGVTIVKSGGDARGDNYDINSDLWTNDTRQVVVAAVDQDGFVSSYSSYGAANLVSGFGTPGEVVTTDRVGADGYNGTDFTSTFNGTSAAAPMVAGIVALMYEANEDLGWRDVQNILGVSARHVGTAVGSGTTGSERYAWEFNGASTWNGGGQHFSSDYGYGLVDALAAVRLAETWLMTGAMAFTSSNQASNTMDVLDVATVIPDGNLTGLSFVGAAAIDDIVERVTVTMDFSTTFTGDVEIYLTSPSGTESILIADTGGGNNFSGVWTFESQAFRGERAAGNWTIRIVDDAGGDVLQVNDVVIRTYGAPTTDDRYVFTDEYSDYSSGAFGHTTAINDANGGMDTVNAAAVTSNSNIRLDGVVGSIDGVAASFTNIENAIGGDGNDGLTGNIGANQLYGMRGNDFLNGLGGDDTLEGGTGDDSMLGGAGNDRMEGGLGNDVLRGGNDNDLLIGNSGNDDMFGDAGNDDLNGGGGTDNLFGGAGNDSMVGGAQADFLSGGGNNDLLFGGDDNDTLNGDDGDDEVFGDAGRDLLDGGTGDDTLSGGAQNDTLLGGDDNDSLLGGTNEDRLEGNTGNDTLRGEQGHDTLIGADGNDLLNGGIHNDWLYGGNGNDVLIGEGGVDRLFGDNGNDQLLGLQGTDILYGGAGNDTLQGGDGNDTMNGGSNEDRLEGGANNDVLNGEAGFDTLFGQDGNDTLNGGIHNDVLYGGANNDVLNGDGGNDTLWGGTNEDRLDGGVGNDSLEGEQGHDTLIGGVGGDTLSGGIHNDWLYGGNDNDVMAGDGGVDRLFGQNGNDILLGGAGNDILYGGANNDLLDGGLGNDLLSGGAFADVFVFVGVFGDDTITDFDEFNNFEDIDLSGVGTIVNYADLLANHMTQVGADVVIDDGLGNTITVVGVNIADMNNVDFVF